MSHTHQSHKGPGPGTLSFDQESEAQTSRATSPSACQRKGASSFPLLYPGRDGSRPWVPAPTLDLQAPGLACAAVGLWDGLST